MKRIFLATSVFFACLLGTASADVNPTSPALSAPASDCAKARKAGRTCSLVFDGDTVDGTRVGGDGDNISVAAPAGFGNLIRMRESFRDMIVQTAEDL